MIVGDLIKEVYRFWGVTHTRLPEERVLEIVNRKIKKYLLDLQMASGSYLAKISPAFRINSENFRLNIGDLSNITRIEYRENSTDEWQEAKFAPFHDWARYRDMAEVYVTVFGQAPHNNLQANGDYRNREYRVIYETSDAMKKIFNSQTGLQDIFTPLLFCDVAIEAGMMVSDRSPDWIAERTGKIAYLSNELNEWKDKFKKWTRADKTQSVGQREAYDSRVYDEWI